ncbi:MAG: hypothetical protein IJR83_04780 [Clostridia bacterium]|nr:hypothetical protein [Clostridia bacterium]
MKGGKTRRFLAKNWITLWLVAAILLGAIVTVSAVYADVNNKIKRVVTPAAKTGSLFSSNYLVAGSGNIRTAHFSGDPPYVYDLVIRNHRSGDPGKVFERPFTYTLHAQLVKKTGVPFDETDDAAALAAMPADGITITCGTDVITLDGTHLSGSNTQTHTLSGTGATGQDTWYVSYNNIGLDTDYCVKFTATPQAGTDLETLEGTVIVGSYPAVHQEGWSCMLAESGNISDYDAFNYVITGTGERDLKFSYDAEKFAVNPAFYLLNAEVDAPVAYSGEGHTGWVTVVIHADPDTTQVNRYDLQLFKVDSYQPAAFSEVTPVQGGYVEFKTD